MKYRLSKTIHASGYVQWNVEKRVFFFWIYVAGYYDEEKALYTLSQLRLGVPETRKVIVNYP